jgi:anti-sigma B factor antagonist
VLTSPASRAAPDPGQLLSVTTLPAGRPGRVVVEVTGEVDAYTAPVLNLCLQSQAARPAVREIVADLRRVTLLGAAGVTALAMAERRCRTRGARLMIATGGRRDILRVLRLSGFADVVTVDPVAVEQRQTAGERAAPHVPPRTSSRRRHARPVRR